MTTQMNSGLELGVFALQHSHVCRLSTSLDQCGVNRTGVGESSVEDPNVDDPSVGKQGFGD